MSDIIELLIRVTPQGTQLNGPIDNTLLCCGILEVAKEIVLEHQRKRMQAAQDQRVTLASQLPPNGHR